MVPPRPLEIEIYENASYFPMSVINNLILHILFQFLPN